MNIMSIPISHLCVITAADIEFKAVTGRLHERAYSQSAGLKQCHGRAGRNFVTVLQSEIGAHGFREKLTAHLSTIKYDALLIIGLAGGLSPELKTGEVIFYDTCFVFRPEFGTSAESPEADQSTVCDFQVSSALRQLMLEEGLQCMFGAGLTLDFMVTTPEEKLAMGESYGAAAVDMESHDVIAVGSQFGLPVIVLRVILDEATQKTPDFNLALDAQGQMNNLKALFSMLLRPVAAIQFFFSLSQAMKVLRRAANVALLAEPKLLRPTTALVIARKPWG
jgi:nucleoside phosphorylase